MTEPKAVIYAKLAEITDATVYQERPEVLKTFPCITFSIAGNVPNYTLDKTSHESVEVKIDIWGDSSIVTGGLLSQVEAKMLELDYRCTSNFDLPDPDPKVHHISTFFSY